MVSHQPPSGDVRPVPRIGAKTGRPLRLLRYHRKRGVPKPGPHRSDEVVAQMATAAQPKPRWANARADDPIAQGDLCVSLCASRPLHLPRQTVIGRTVCLNWASTNSVRVFTERCEG